MFLFFVHLSVYTLSPRSGELSNSSFPMFYDWFPINKLAHNTTRGDSIFLIEVEFHIVFLICTIFQFHMIRTNSSGCLVDNLFLYSLELECNQFNFLKYLERFRSFIKFLNTKKASRVQKQDVQYPLKHYYVGFNIRKRLLKRCIHNFILSIWTICACRVHYPRQWSLAKHCFKKLKNDTPRYAKTSWSQKGWCNKPTKLQFQSI